MKTQRILQILTKQRKSHIQRGNGEGFGKAV